MILLFTDFGWAGPYVGQMKAVLAEGAPGVPVIDLMHDAPAFRPRPAGVLLAALLGEIPAGAVVLAVVDPGVGTPRAPLVVAADGRRLVGPDNGLFEPALRRARSAEAWRITWQPARLSASFHGRDLFAPVAARLARGEPVPGEPVPLDRVRRPDWPEVLAEIVYVDAYGNAMTGLSAGALPPDAMFTIAGRRIAAAAVFGAVPPGTAFWYVNSLGLIEIAINQGDAAAALGLAIGTAVSWEREGQSPQERAPHHP